MERQRFSPVEPKRLNFRHYQHSQQKPMRALELKIPPGVVVLIAAVLMWLLSRAGSAFAVMLPARTAAMFSLIAVGAVLSALG